MTKEDFVLWKDQDVTVRVFELLLDRRENAVNQLALGAGVDSTQDRFLVGYIAGLDELLNMTTEE
jgi:hypothetical protein